MIDSDLVYKSTVILKDGTIETNALLRTKLYPFWSNDTIKLNDELKTIQKLISKQKNLSGYKPGDVTLGQRVKEIKAELKKRGYFR